MGGDPDPCSCMSTAADLAAAAHAALSLRELWNCGGEVARVTTKLLPLPLPLPPGWPRVPPPLWLLMAAAADAEECPMKLTALLPSAAPALPASLREPYALPKPNPGPCQGLLPALGDMLEWLRMVPSGPSTRRYGLLPP